MCSSAPGGSSLPPRELWPLTLTAKFEKVLRVVGMQLCKQLFLLVDLAPVSAKKPI